MTARDGTATKQHYGSKGQKRIAKLSISSGKTFVAIGTTLSSIIIVVVIVIVVVEDVVVVVAAAVVVVGVIGATSTSGPIIP